MKDRFGSPLQRFRVVAMRSLEGEDSTMRLWHFDSESSPQGTRPESSEGAYPRVSNLRILSQGKA